MEGTVKMTIRDYKISDGPFLARLFYDTVHSVNVRDYAPDQIDAWAPADRDISAWSKSFLNRLALVAEEEGKIIGFGDIDGTGYLDRLYVHKDFQGKGIATAICQILEKDFDHISVHASITARPFFEKRGYKVIKEQTVIRSGVRIKNYVMEKDKEK